MNTLNNECCPDEQLGAKPANIKWSVVRGDTATLLIQFLENDETTNYNIDGWTFIATAYDKKSEVFTDLDVELVGADVKIIATPAVTDTWGTCVKDKVAELSFDLQVTTLDNTVWTPVIGTITVIGDVTGVPIS